MCASVSYLRVQKPTTCKLADANKKQIICVGKIPIELVAPDEVKPTFRTPCAVHTLW